MRYRRIFVPGGTYFFTVVTYLRRPIFTDEDAIHLLENVIEFVQVRHPFNVLAYVIFPSIFMQYGNYQKEIRITHCAGG